jgi:alkanesulfonate monooxygenase
MPVEFVGVLQHNTASEYLPLQGPQFDPAFALELAREYERSGWDRILYAYFSGSPDPAQIAAWISGQVPRIKILLAHRPNVSFPTYAARQFAALDVLSGGRLAVHFITGGNDHEQQREGDYLPKDERYARTHEYIRIVKQTWAAREPFSHDGRHYQFADFVSDFEPVQRPRPVISFGGSSAAANEVGVAEADVYGLWGEPLALTAQQIAHIRSVAERAGRPADHPLRFMLFLRPIVAETDELAWEKAFHIADTIRERGSHTAKRRRIDPSAAPENEGTKRLLRAAATGERHDRAGWFPGVLPALAGTVAINLVGTPDTVADAFLDYYDIGISVFQIRGYETLRDAEVLGREVLPRIRAGVAARDAAREAARVAGRAAEAGAAR